MISSAEVRSRDHSPRRVRADAITVIVMASLASIAVISLALGKFFDVFRPQGVFWSLPIAPTDISAEGLTLYDSNGPVSADSVSGTAHGIETIVPGLSGASTFLLGAAICLAALTALVIIACTGSVAWRFLRGEIFSRATSIALRVLSWSGLVGGFAAYGAWSMGANGVEAALGVRASASGSGDWWAWYGIILFIVVSFGLIDIGLRRGLRLQKDTEGLV